MILNILHIASNLVFYKRTNYIEVNYQFNEVNITSRSMATSFANSNDQLSNIFTKSLKGPRIKHIYTKLSTSDLYVPAWKGVIYIYIYIYVCVCVCVCVRACVCASIVN